MDQRQETFIKAVGYGLLHREDLTVLAADGASRLGVWEALEAYGLGRKERALLTGRLESLHDSTFERRYVLLGDLGRGGMGVVSRAFDTTLNRVVALKRLLPEAASSNAWDRFFREARALARLDHPSCVRVYDYGVAADNGTPYMALQLVLGRSLRDRVSETQPAHWEEVARWGQQLAEGLAACHAVGLVHRDIKPANILLERSQPSRALLADFGIAFAVGEGERLTKTGGFLGTYAFCAPETLDTRNSEPNPRSDLYSLGLSLYVALTHTHPYEASSLPGLLEAMGRPIPPIRGLAPDTPDWLASAIHRCLESKPRDRFRDATELAYALTGGQSGARLVAAEEKSTRDDGSRARSASWTGLVACGALGVGGVLGFGLTTAPALPKVSAASPSAATPDASPSSTPAHSRPRLEPLHGGEWRNTKDGTTLARIPAGEFVYGSDDGLENERPRRRVRCEAFLIGRYEVTWGQFDRFCVASGRKLKERKVEGVGFSFVPGPNHPATRISKAEAEAYCEWAGGRLPTEQEWEYAARGPDGRKFPWADGSRVARPANVADESVVRAQVRLPSGWAIDPTKGYDDGFPATAPVGSFPEGLSAFGLHDMAGNAIEITASVYESGNPVLRGGGWTNSLWGARTTARHEANLIAGFRLAMASE